MAQLLTAKWKVVIRAALRGSSTVVGLRRPWHPGHAAIGWRRGVPLIAAVRAIVAEIPTWTPGGLDQTGVRHCALILVAHGSRQVQQLDGVVATNLACLHLVAAEQVIVMQSIETVAAHAKLRRVSRAATFGFCLSSSVNRGQQPCTSRGQRDGPATQT